MVTAFFDEGPGLIIFSSLAILLFLYRVYLLKRQGPTIRNVVFFTLTLTTLVMTVALAIAVLSGEFLAALSDRDHRSIPELIWSATPEIAFVAIVMASAAGMAAIVLGRTLSQPIERITEAADRIAAGERQAALPQVRSVEVQRLTDSFESMRRELAQHKEVETLAADLSHQLKNPVAAIRASSEVLSDAIGNDDEQAQKFADHIHQASLRLDELLSDLLALARIEAHGLENTERLSLEKIVNEALSRLAVASESKSIQIEKSLEAGVLVKGSREWLLRAIENLLSNAIDFNPEGGRIHIRFEDDGEMVALVISDEGPGIAPAVQEKLFQRFNSTRYADGGTGLGLAIVRAVAESHGGNAELKRSSKDGSVFFLRLPLA